MRSAVQAVLLFTATVLAPPVAGAVELPFRERAALYALGQGARSVGSADLDGDGDLDTLAVERYPAPTPDGITWWEDSGSLPSNRQPVETNFDGAASVVAADIDGDGDLDVLGGSTDGLIVWWANTAGDGTAWTRHTVASGFGAISVVAADVDGDGDLDVLGAANVADELAWWRNTAGNGTTWTKQSVDSSFDSPFSVAAADIDGDGDLDVLAGTSNIGGVAWWENSHPTGNGSTWTEHTVIGGGGGVSVLAADMDRDGDLDVLVAMLSSGGIRWWENTQGNGTAWVAHPVKTPFNTASVAAADLDADGDLDVLGAGTFPDHELIWWENTARNGTAWAEHTLDGAYLFAGWIHAADLDGDGDLDVLAASSNTEPTWLDDIVRFENVTVHRSAVYPTRRLLDPDPVSAVVLAADLDGDGDQDVLAGDWNGDAIVWWENAAGDATEWTPRTVAPFAGVRSVHAADMDGDGDLDVLGAALDAGDVAWWANTAGDGTAWTRHDVDANFDGAFSVVAADMDGDGDQDVLAGASHTNPVSWWENTTGLGTAWTKRSASGVGISVKAADIDGDGDMDALAADPDDGVVNLFWNSAAPGGLPVFVSRTLLYLPGATAAFAADMDADGDLDIEGAAATGGDVRWWRNDGPSGAWNPHDVGQLAAAETIVVADLDHDGDPDVLAAGGGAAGEVVWWENDGTACGPTCSWPERSMDAALPFARSIGVADLDRDGDLDVLGGGSNHAAWWSNGGGQFALATMSTAPAMVADGQTVGLMRIDASHRGRSGDLDLELVSFELLFEEAPGDPLTTAEAGALLQSLRVYLDDGSGAFDVADTLLESVGSLALDAGVQTVTVQGSSAVVLTPGGAPRTYFVVAQMTGNASAQTPHQFRLSHRTESSSRARDVSFTLPVSLEYAANVSSGTVAAVGRPDLIFADGFE